MPPKPLQPFYRAIHHNLEVCADPSRCGDPATVEVMRGKTLLGFCEPHSEVHLELEQASLDEAKAAKAERARLRREKAAARAAAKAEVHPVPLVNIDLSGEDS